MRNILKNNTYSKTIIMSEPIENKVKTKKIKVKKASTEEPVVEQTPVVEEAPVVETHIVETPIVETPIVETHVVETPVVETHVVEESNTEILFNKFVNQFQDIQSVMKTLHANLKVLQKEVIRERKEYKKKELKIKKKNSKKKNPSGIVKPTPISPELSNFLGLSLGEQIARTEVTSKVISYVKEHNLQNPMNKKQILPDEKLKELLQPGDTIVSFFNLQTFLKKHFDVSTTETTTTTTVV